ncbi:universal stress protein [Saccharothrix mutabilis subsp. mutabilis]|uniref:Universal stress protein n=1 Tax=Saccharothrix mutabilis subsp. mutabilis TaxID=66855 RepID=A0ABN0UH32_9PSEU
MDKEPGAPVVVGVDGSASALEAVAWAADECLRHRAPLRLVHACMPPIVSRSAFASVGEDLDRALRAQGHKWLRQARDAARAVARDIAVTTRLAVTGPVPLLVDESGRARLVVLGSRGLSGVGGLLVGSTALALASHGRCPLVVVRDAPAPDGPVVVGVDGSPVSEAAVAFAFEAASIRGAPLTAVMSWQDFMVDPGYHDRRIATDWTEVEEDERRLLAQRLAGWQEKFPDVHVDRVVRRDNAARLLVRLGEGARLLVVGSHGHEGFTGLLLGSTARTLVRHAPCPLAVVRPHDRPHRTSGPGHVR